MRRRSFALLGTRVRALSGTGCLGLPRFCGLEPGSSRWSRPHAAVERPPGVWSTPPIVRIYCSSAPSPCRGVLSSVRSSSGRLSIPAVPHCVVLQRWRWGGLQLGRRAGASEVTRAARSSAASSLSPVWQSALGLFLGPPGIWISSPGGKKKSPGPDSNPRPSDPQPSTLTTRTRELDASEVCIFIPRSAHGASSSWGLEERGGRRRRRERLRICLSPNGGSRHWRWSHWGVLLAVCWVLHLGLVALPVAPRPLHVGLCAVSLRLGVWWPPCSRLARPPGCRIPHRRRVVFSSGDGGSYSARLRAGVSRVAWSFLQFAWSRPPDRSHLVRAVERALCAPARSFGSTWRGPCRDSYRF